MRKSGAITLTILAGLTMTGCCLTSLGCGRRGSHTPGPTTQQYEPPDHTWYDANGNPIPEKWKTDANGNRLLDEHGRPIPDPAIPYDRHRRPWEYRGGSWAPLLIPLVAHAASSRSGSSSFLTGGSGYRSPGTTTYRSGTGSGSTSFGSSSSSSSHSASSSSSSISRGGFGSTGSSSSSSSSS